MNDNKHERKKRGPNVAYNQEEHEMEWNVRGIFSARAMYRMQSMHLTEKQIAERSRGLISDATVSNCVHNRTEPGLRAIAGLMRGMDCTADDLIALPERLKQKQKIPKNPNYTGLSMKAQDVLHRHTDCREESLKNNLKYQDDVSVLSAILEDNGDKILEALWLYLCCADRAKLSIRKAREPSQKEKTAYDNQQAANQLDTARKDLEAAQSRLARVMFSSIEQTTDSAGLLKELDRLYVRIYEASQPEKNGAE